jgi:hypothetical protein
VTNWTPERIRGIADRMAARLGREVRVSPVTLPLVVTALGHYADDLAIASALGTAEYRVREWDGRGSLVRELAVCRDATAFAFSFAFEDAAGRHAYRRSDWETRTTYWKWAKKYGEEEALTKAPVQKLQRRLPDQGRGLRYGDCEGSAQAMAVARPHTA